MKQPAPPGDSDWSTEKYLWLQGKMEQINQGAAAKAQVAAHRGGCVEYICVPKVPINYCIPTIPAATSTQKTLEGLMQPLYQKLAWEKWVKKPVLKGIASIGKLHCN